MFRVECYPGAPVIKNFTVAYYVGSNVQSSAIPLCYPGAPFPGVKMILYPK